jgi:surface polysaccharide O-acyltransferase-like enzyme
MYSVVALHIFHGTKIAPCFISTHWWSFFGVAVPLFFMVSGYLICYKTVTPKYICIKIIGILKYVFITVSPFVIYGLLLGNMSSWKSYYIVFHQYGPLPVYWYFGAMIIVYLFAPYIQILMNDKRRVYFMGGTFIVCQIIFLLNIEYDFERLYVRQMYRIWNWFFYFSLGMFVRQYMDRLLFVRWWHVIISAMICMVFMYSMHSKLSGNEYFFCSAPCMLYVFLLFVVLNRININKSRIISLLSNLFLPIFTIHELIYDYWKKYVGLVIEEPNLNMVVNYLLCAIIITSVSYLIMRLPFANKVFKI